MSSTDISKDKRMDTLIFGIVILWFIVGGILLYTTIETAYNNKRVDEAQEKMFAYVEQTELLQSSQDELTNLVRQFAVSDIFNYSDLLNEYFDELNNKQSFESALAYFEKNEHDTGAVSHLQTAKTLTDQIRQIELRSIELKLTALGISDAEREYDITKGNTHFGKTLKFKNNSFIFETTEIPDEELSEEEQDDLAVKIINEGTYNAFREVVRSEINVVSNDVVYATRTMYDECTKEIRNDFIIQCCTFGVFLIILVVLIFALLKKSKSILALTEEINGLLEQTQIAKSELEVAKNKAENASDAKTDFLSKMSHDIRTPINGVIGMTDIAKKHIDDKARVEDCLAKIDTAAHHLLSLINDVLDMSRIESGKTVISHESVDMRRFANNCISIVQGQMIDRSLEFETNTKNVFHPHVYGDELRLRQILINLFSNSIKFTPDGGKIIFNMREVGSTDDKVTYEIQVADTGIGMSEEFLQKIWEPFTQDEGGAKSKYKGTGLGTSITKQFVDLMGGDIQVESRLNEGSKFTITITFDIDKEAVDTLDVKRVVTIKGAKVLLADDNDLNREIATEILVEHGAMVDEAEDGQVCVDKFKSSPTGFYDIILMDCMMPVMDGLEATRNIRDLHRQDARSIPIIALTANAFDEDIKKTKEAGMNAHISKPIEVPVLLKTIANYYKKEY